MDGNPISIVEYFRDHSGYRCGYCKSEDSNYSHGMWAHRMTPKDYQTLINRGWRRSGKYCYKPAMDKTCCPQYTIKCDVTKFHPTKSQKKIIKRMYNFLSYGKQVKNNLNSDNKNVDIGMSDNDDEGMKREIIEKNFKCDINKVPSFSGEKCPVMRSSEAVESCSKVENSFKKLPNESPKRIAQEKKSSLQDQCRSQQVPKVGLGPDPTRAPCLKKKALRRQKFIESGKAASKGAAVDSFVQLTLEQLLNKPLPENAVHKLEVRLVPSGSLDSSLDVTLALYRRYETTIHDKPENRCTKPRFTRFLCDNPLPKARRDMSDGPAKGYGGFHHQYWLDNKLIAVGVLDVLPLCISSVYFFYDPDYSFLSLGTYSSLRELALTRELHHLSEKLQFYYMGFYIHSCSKMRYKANFAPSFLLCPKTYKWNDIGAAVEKLNQAKYCIFFDDAEGDRDLCNIDEVLCLYESTLCKYGVLRRMEPREDEEEVKEYATLVGGEAAPAIALFRNLDSE